MRASCCFTEPSCLSSCTMVCHLFQPGKTSRAVSGNIAATSFSLMFFVCFMILLIWGGCTTVDGLVDEQLPMQPATMSNTTYGDSVLMKFAHAACGNNSHNCVYICEICYSIHDNSTMDCLSTLFSDLCLSNFKNAMSSLNNTEWCTWDNVRSLYSNLSLCTEELSDCLLIPWPNPLVEQTFVYIHSTYFRDCPTEELNDPPPVIVFALVITPICLIPVMVSLVVLKTKNGDGSS